MLPITVDNVLFTCLALGLDAAGAGPNSFAAKYGVLQVREQAHNTGTHTVRPFYGAAVGFTALGAHSWHKV